MEFVDIVIFLSIGKVILLIIIDNDVTLDGYFWENTLILRPQFDRSLEKRVVGKEYYNSFLAIKA